MAGNSDVSCNDVLCDERYKYVDKHLVFYRKKQTVL